MVRGKAYLSDVQKRENRAKFIYVRCGAGISFFLFLC